MQPRVIRLKDASKYLGMDKNLFNEQVRPKLTEFSIGKMGIGFDRVDLDAWFDHYKKCNGRPAKEKVWDEKERQDSISEMESGTSTKLSLESAFAKAQALATSKKRKST